MGGHLLPVLTIHSNEISLNKEGYRNILVGGWLASRGIEYLMRPGYLVEHRYSLVLCNADSGIFLPLGAGCSSSSDVDSSLVVSPGQVTPGTWLSVWEERWKDC